MSDLGLNRRGATLRPRQFESRPPRQPSLTLANNSAWPGHSLLCAGYNAAGVAATALGTTKIHFGEVSRDIQIWGVTRDELARVLVATMISLEDWPRIMFGMVSGALSPGLRQKMRAALRAQADAAET